MKRAKILITVIALFSPAASAQSINVNELGALALTFTAVKAVDTYQGRPMAATVSYRPGEALSLVAPVRVRQISYLHAPGTPVDKNEEIALLNGPEIHHFITAFQVLETRLSNAERRFNSNKKLYDSKAIDESRWVEISEAYYALQLEYEHMHHFRTLLEPGGEKDGLWLKSPAIGLLDYRQSQPGVEAGQPLAQLIPPQALRLRVAAPLTQRTALVALAFGECQLPVDSVGAMAKDYFVETWSAPLTDACKRLPGERLMVTPLLSAAGYRVPRDAVMQWQGETALLIRNGELLEPVIVTLLATAGTDYIVSCDADLAGRSVLSSSVSAVQGVLMGLGGE